MTAVETGAVAIGLAACATDVCTRRIPNALTGPAVLLGFAAHAWLPGGQGAWHAAIGLVVGLAVFFPFFALGGMGGGDVKLMAALGSWIGWQPIVWTALYGAVAGGLLAVVVGLAHGYLRQAVSNVGGLLMFWATQGIKPMAALTLEHGHGPRLPYALPIFAGLLVTLWRH
jgi:prepilin peptidase CpaA